MHTLDITWHKYYEDMGWDKFGDRITPVIQMLNNHENIVCMVKRCSHINQEWEWGWRGEANIVGLNIA